MMCSIFRWDGSTWQAAYGDSFYECREESLVRSKNAQRLEKGLRLFFPLETDVRAGDKLMTADCAAPTTEALTVLSVRCIDFGSPRMQHKEVLCR